MFPEGVCGVGLRKLTEDLRVPFVQTGVCLIKRLNKLIISMHLLQQRHLQAHWYLLQLILALSHQLYAVRVSYMQLE